MTRARKTSYVMFPSLLIMCGSTPGIAQTPYEDALKAIRETVPVICQTVPTSQTNSEFKLNAELNALIKKLTNLGLSGAAQYQSGKSSGVLQSQLANAVADRNNCAIKALQILTDTLAKVPPSTAKVPPSTAKAPPSTAKAPPSTAKAPSSTNSTIGDCSPIVGNVDGNFNLNCSPQSRGSPVVLLMAQDQDYDLEWNPSNDLQPRLYLSRRAGDTSPRVEGKPTFRIKNVGSETAAPIEIEWQIAATDLLNNVQRSARLQKYYAKITDTTFGLFTTPPTDDETRRVLDPTASRTTWASPGTEAKAYGMRYARTSHSELQYLAPEQDNTVPEEMPFDVVNFLEISALATIPVPDPTTAPTYEVSTVPVLVTISWDTPQGGKAYHYRIDAKFRSTRPWVGGGGRFIQEPPEVMAHFTFSVSRVE